MTTTNITIHTADSPVETARLLANRLTELIAQTQGDVHLAVSGGNTPAVLFAVWAAEYADRTPWQRLHLYWVDERCVPPTHADSNYGMTLRQLLQKVPLPDDHIHRIKGENNPAEEARRYEAEVRRLTDNRGFDIVILGAGDDGHTSSIFPGQTELLHCNAWYSVSQHPINGIKRVALTGQPICNVPHLIFHITGKNKQPVCKDIMEGRDTGPAAYVAHHATGCTEVFADSDAAGTTVQSPA